MSIERALAAFAELRRAVWREGDPFAIHEFALWVCCKAAVNFFLAGRRDALAEVSTDCVGLSGHTLSMDLYREGAIMRRRVFFCQFSHSGESKR